MLDLAPRPVLRSAHRSQALRSAWNTRQPKLPGFKQKSQIPRKIPIAVREEANFARDAKRLTPRIEDERIVYGRASDGIDTAGPISFKFSGNLGQVEIMACRKEGSGQTKRTTFLSEKNSRLPSSAGRPLP